MKKDILIVVGIVALSLFIALNVVDGDRWHPEVSEYDSNIP
jgi:hypothetical protein